MCDFFPALLLDIPRSHLDVHPLDDAGDDVEDLHFGVALSHLLQQLEEQPKYRLEVLNKEKEDPSVRKEEMTARDFFLLISKTKQKKKQDTQVFLH